MMYESYADLDGQLTLSCIFRINGELDRQAGWKTRGQSWSTGRDLAGIVCGQDAQFKRAGRERLCC